MFMRTMFMFPAVTVPNISTSRLEGRLNQEQ